ncbi:FAD dependent oxidoreductase [Annulohypoxylon truncatum]|uniref:FAD dependent oxidoreductase n=1 Tax=Annulohypoxylon truncatum TaxID=327061 RepID=UPI0020082208|nr:FAD dependent oxidoreductase [Annulohypoxylon truncatum]KAI1214127.1 FAD dependent oxidoreductase [Annulohypoxylon truncatum]
MFARTARRQLQSSTGLSCLARSFSSTAPVRADFTHVIIGGGVVGLSIARALASHNAAHNPSNTTLLLERHPHLGTETSSRNSEVIHGGLYYGPTSLKTRLCVAGREQLYAFCKAHAVPHRKTGKWVVAQDASQLESLHQIHETCARELVGVVPTRFVGKEEARRLEPGVRAHAGVLESPETGIVDSHALMVALRGLFEDEGGVVAVNSNVVGIEALRSSSPTSSNSNSNSSNPGSAGYRLTVRDSSTGEASSITTSTLINSAGLGAFAINNLILPPERHVRAYFAKGNYFSYAASAPRVSRLVYPVTPPGAGGLGTHLTLDMAGRVRFGPDVEWVTSPADLAVSAARLPAAIAEIRKYLPGIDVEALAPDYAGIRPKLRPAGAVGDGGKDKGKGDKGDKGGSGFVDFYIRKEDGYEGFVNLLGIESPGLTSCLAIGALVRDMLVGSARVEGSARL